MLGGYTSFKKFNISQCFMVMTPKFIGSISIYTALYSSTTLNIYIISIRFHLVILYQSLEVAGAEYFQISIGMGAGLIAVMTTARLVCVNFGQDLKRTI